MQITKEMVEALAWLRTHWTEGNTEYAIEAFNVLDNAGFFRPIDEHTGYDVDPEPEYTGPRKDPAEWGDLTGYAPPEGRS